MTSSPVFPSSLLTSNFARLNGIKQQLKERQVSEWVELESCLNVLKEVEQLLRKQEACYQALTMAVSSIAWSTEPDDGGDRSRPNQENPPQSQASELETLEWLEAVHSDDREMTWECWQQVYQTGTQFRVEHRLRVADGSYHYFQTQGVAICQEDGSIVDWAGVHIDIHERKQTEQTLRESTERFRLAQRAARAGAWDWYVPDNTIIWSDEYYSLYGLDPNIPANLENWLNCIHPGDRDTAYQMTTAALEQNSEVDIEFRVLHPDGIRWFNAIGQVFCDEHGNPTRMTGITLDVTRRKQAEDDLRQSERRLRRLVESNMFGVAFGDFKAGIHYANDYFLQMIGYTKAELETGQIRWLDMTPPEYLSLDWQAAEELRQQGVSTPFKKEYIRKDGSRIPILIGGALLDEPFDQQEEIVAFYLDLTPLKQAEDQLNLYADIVDHIQLGIVVWQLENPDDPGSWRLLAANPAAHSTSGIDFRQMIGCTMAEQFPSVLRSPLIHQYFEVVQTVQAQNLQDIYYSEDGFDGIYAVKAFPLPNRCLGLAFENVTQQRQTEAALQINRERLDLVLDAAQLGLWYCDLPFSELIWNDRCKEHFGLPLEANVDIDVFYERLHPDDRARTREAIERSIDQYSKYDIDYRTVALDGRVRWIRAIGHAFYNTEGHPYRFDGITIDNTQQKQIEAALRENEERLQLALSVTQTIAWDINLKTQTVVCSENALTILSIIQGNLVDFFTFIHPEDRDRVSQTIRDALARQEAYQQEYRLIDRNGRIRWFLSQGEVYVADGQPERMIGVSIDISDRKQSESALRQSEERYRYLAELIPQLVWTANAEGILLDINQRWIDYTGLTLAQAQLAGWEAVVHPDDILILSANWTNAQQQGTLYQAEGRMRRVDGAYRWHLHQAVPQKNERGQITKWFGTATDIENQKQLEYQRDRILQQEQAAREAAEQANRIKDEFLAVLSHELRSPLNPILGWVNLLRTRQFDSNMTQRALEIIDRNAHLQSQLIEDLLDVSRILQGKLQLHTVAVDLSMVIEHALETVRLAAEAKSITIQTHLSTLEGRVLGDSARLQQVVWNLLSNAVKFTPAGGRVEVTLSRSLPQLESQITRDQEPTTHNPEPVTHYAEITVTDTGKGINPEFLPYVFDYFRQADSTTTRQFGGLGLGLAIVRYIVELHGGTVEAHSPGEGQGATFTVRLPLLSAHQLKKSMGTQPSAQSMASSQHPLIGIQILVVDDVEDMRELAKYILEAHGATVQVAASGQEVLELLTHVLPDILLCDIGMPDMDGYMLLRELRSRSVEQGGQIPAIALTAYASDLNRQQALQAGFQYHLSKPVEAQQLVEAIATVVKQNLPQILEGGRAEG